jgi:glucosamine 6-phosphate synthetase-like amidotransferase/phosphosugar isomerase protein
MCGLVGVAGNISVKEEGVFKRLLELDTVRGPHSTGVLGVSTRGDANIIKKVGTPWDLYQHKQFDEMMRGSFCVLMGHNRWATKGKINSYNAHPFEHGHIFGAHNGTLRNQSLLPDYKEFEVDSDNIFYSMSILGVDQTVNKLSGAFALTWYDAEAQMMNFIRNEERPLIMCESEDKRTVFWASERWMLEVALGLAGIKYREPFQPKPGQLFSYPIEIAYAPKAFKDVYVRNLELHEYKVYKNHSTGYNSTTKTEVKNTSTGTTQVFEKAKESEVGKSKAGKVTPEMLIKEDQIEFFVSSIQTSKHTGQRWLECMATMDNCDVELRVYANDESLEYWANSTHILAGKVTGLTTMVTNIYCTIAPGTIVEVINKEIDEYEEEMVVVFGGQIVSESDYEVMVGCGCSNCKSIPDVEGSEDIIWLDELNFVCGDCKDLPVIKDFIEKYDEKATVKH